MRIDMKIVEAIQADIAGKDIDRECKGNLVACEELKE